MVDDGPRYPFPPYPTGWYLVAQSVDVGVGDVKPVHYFGRELVLFRTERGHAVILDAHCPHMGAHLGYGGRVEAEGIRCPFHSWRFDAAGRCDDVPYSRLAALPLAGLACWPVHETSGLILVHYSEHGLAPSWWMPDRAEWDSPGWVGYELRGWRIRMHTQELAENIPDTAHFLYVHSLPAQPVAEVEVDRHVYRQRTVTRAGDDEFAFTQEAFGLGLVWLHVPGRAPGAADISDAGAAPAYTFLTATTPIDEESVDLRLLFLVNEGPGATGLSQVGRALIEATAENTARDVPIWEHKVYRQRAPLVPGDGPINVLRRWARQFYEPPQATEGDPGDLQLAGTREARG